MGEALFPHGLDKPFLIYERKKMAGFLLGLELCFFKSTE
jgi:hypothetical protein